MQRAARLVAISFETWIDRQKTRSRSNYGAWTLLAINGLGSTISLRSA